MNPTEVAGIDKLGVAGAETHPGQSISIDGKFFRLGTGKFHVKGITYGPFAPASDGQTFGSQDQVAGDFRLIRELGANLLRVYYVPPPWFLDLAVEHGLRLLIDVPWPKHLCFFESSQVQQDAREAVRKAATACKNHPAVFALSVVNEIPAEIVRWSGEAEVTGFLDDLVDEAKAIAPDMLCTFASFPPTEFLCPQNIDFLCFNVYLHQPKNFKAYLARLQTLADSKPLLLGEFGIDSLREGEEAKCELLTSQLEIACRCGLAGTIVYSFTDDWHRGGRQIEDWAFGLTTRDRQPKKSFFAVQKIYQVAPYFPLSRAPRVSVVVASYNGARTLEACLSSLTKLNYPDYEVILVDDGSTDNTQEIARRYPSVRVVYQENLGLSAARNSGIRSATGEIVAFTDSDCRADEDWLFYLVGDLLREGFVAIGGHNFLPPEDSPVAAAVLVSPGGPAHVMLTDCEAEHIPGCNMAFFKWALVEIDGFDPVFRKAGDDVDVCWRLQQRGYRIGFSPAGFVWHYRRSTVRAYLKQQAGYGEAEALLVGKHPENFNFVGGGAWRGRIYAPSKYGLILRGAVIYHGIFGSGFFQKLYSPAPAHALMLCTSLEYHLLLNFTLLSLSIYFPVLLPLAVASLTLSFAVCVLASIQAKIPADKARSWSRPLVAGLFFLQPLVRGWARYRTRLHLRAAPGAAATTEGFQSPGFIEPVEQLCFWSHGRADRYTFLRSVLDHLKQSKVPTVVDSGWDNHDLEVLKSPWTCSTLTTASEHLAQEKLFLRCRLKSKWSALAITFFALLTLAESMVIGHFARVLPWVWLLLPTLPLLAWFFEEQRREQSSMMAGVVRIVSLELKLEKYNPAGLPARATPS